MIHRRPPPTPDRIARLRSAFESTPRPPVTVVVELMQAQFDSGDRPGAIETHRRFSQLDPRTAQADSRVRGAFDRVLWSVPKTPPGNLPTPRNRLVGRHAELAEIDDALTACRFVSLIGAGGIGKTRLALELAQRVLPAYPEGAWWVDLTAARGIDDLCAAVCAVLALEPPSDTLAGVAQRLRDRRLLLVLDRCDALAEAADELGRLLRSTCPGVNVLATTQRAMPSSRAVPVAPLPVPRAGEAHRAAAFGSDAARLFVERAVDADASFALTEANAAAVVDICRLTDGSPFAIENAAAYLSYGDIADLVKRIRDHRADDVQNAAQRSVDWVYGLLAAPETGLLRCASIFPDDFTIDDATAVFGNDAREALAVLVRAALVVPARAPGELTRYRLLDTTRVYAYDRLVGSGEADRVRTRLMAWLVEIAGSWPSLAAVREHVLLALEIGNAFAQHREAALELCGRIESKIATLGSHAKLLSRVRTLVDTARGEGNHSARFAAALGTYARLANYLADPAHAVALHQERIALVRESGDAAALALALASGLPALLNARRFDDARDAGEETLALGRAMDDAQVCADALRGLSALHYYEGDFDGALRCCDEFMALPQERIAKSTIGRMLVGYFANLQKVGNFARGRAMLERALEIARETGDHGLATHCEMSLGFCLLHEGLIVEAHAALQRAVGLSQHGSNAMSQLDALEELAAATIRRDQLEGVAQLLGYVDAQLERQRLALNPYVSGRPERLRAVVKAQLGENAYARAHAAGELLTLAEALERASHLRCGETTLEEADRFALLSPREREVARMVTRGASNREIAEALVVSVRTVDAHVAAILRKLEVARREQIATQIR
ncbi:MAG: ATP-binding protein [Vulcanimicrobiaceae bacterium]